MSLADTARKLLAGGSLMAIVMSFVLDPSFATDAVSVPEPATTALVAIAGVTGLAVSVIRRRKK